MERGCIRGPVCAGHDAMIIFTMSEQCLLLPPTCRHLGMPALYVSSHLPSSFTDGGTLRSGLGGRPLLALLPPARAALTLGLGASCCLCAGGRTRGALAVALGATGGV